MFGYIRFILAYFVLLSHVGIGLAGKNIGVFAVVIFYILAGLVTSKVFIKIAPQNAQISYFVKDRFLRIYPAFLFAFVLTALFFCATSYLQPHFSAKNLLANALIVPLNYFFWLDVSVIDAPAGLNFLIPPAWSLGAELQAYALLVLAIKFRRLGYALALGSLGVYAAANLGFIDSDIYGYRLVCGVFFMFYTGFLIYQKQHGKLAVFYSAMTALACYLFYSRNFGVFSVETALGYLFGTAIVYIVAWFIEPKLKEQSGFKFELFALFSRKSTRMDAASGSSQTSAIKGETQASLNATNRTQTPLDKTQNEARLLFDTAKNEAQGLTDAAREAEQAQTATQIKSASKKANLRAKFNDIAGSLSYSLFISHFLFIWISRFLFGSVNLAFITVSSIVFGLVNFYLIERKINKIRFKKEKYSYKSL